MLSRTDSTSPPWWETLAALSLIAALQMAAVFNPMVVEVDPEEMFNAGQAWQLLECSPTELFRLQYREFCGGCTLDAALGTVYFSLWDRSWLAWKLVPLSFVLLVTAVGSRQLHRLAGRPAAWAFVALLAFPPRAWMYLSLIAWGNHLEAGCIAFCALIMLMRTTGPRMALTTGFVLGVANWVGFSGTFATFGALGWLLLSRRGKLIPPMLGGALIGLLPWLLQFWSTGQHAFVTIYEANESAPSLSRIPFKLSTLFMPRQLVALFGMPEEGLGWLLGWLWALVLLACTGGLLLLARRAPYRRVGHAATGVLCFAGAWLIVYSLVRFQVYDPPAPQIAYPGSARYAAPIYPLAFFTISLVTGLIWQKNRRAALGLLLIPLLSGAQARLEAFDAPYPAPSVAQMEPVDWDWFKPRFAYLYDGEEQLNTLERCQTDDLRTLELHAYTRGRVRAAALLRWMEDETQSTTTSLKDLTPPSSPHASHWWEGLGDALAVHLDNPQLYGGTDVDSLLLLRRALDQIKEVPGGSDSDRGVALRAAATLRMGASDPWVQARNSHDGEAIRKISEALAAVDEEIAQAAWWAHGRAWAQTVVGFHSPSQIHLPEGTEEVPPAFFEGLGRGMGEEWGPKSSIPRPLNLPPQGESALQQGYREGVMRRWLDSSGPSLPDLRIE